MIGRTLGHYHITGLLGKGGMGEVYRARSAHHMIALALLRKGDKNAALSEMQQETNDMWRAMGLATIYPALQQKTQADAMLAQLIAGHGTQYYNIATVCAARGDADHAFECLDKAAVSGPSREVTVDPCWTASTTIPAGSLTCTKSEWLPSSSKR